MLYLLTLAVLQIESYKMHCGSQLVLLQPQILRLSAYIKN